MFQTITGKELKAKLDREDDLVLLETLPAQYYRKAHIPGALNMPHDQVDELASRLAPDKSAQVIVYCANGPCDSSEKAAKRLAELGYKNVFDYQEGKEDWIGLGYPIVKGRAPREAEVSACCAS